MPPRSFCPRLYTPLCVDTLTPAVDCTAVQEHSSVYARAKEVCFSVFPDGYSRSDHVKH